MLQSDLLVDWLACGPLPAVRLLLRPLTGYFIPQCHSDHIRPRFSDDTIILRDFSCVDELIDFRHLGQEGDLRGPPRYQGGPSLIKIFL